MPVISQPELKTGQRPEPKREKLFKPNEDLFKEGERGDEMFVLEEGEVIILKNGDTGPIKLATLSRGAVVGEMALFDNLPRSASARAVQPTKARVINRMLFESVLAQVPLWLRSIVKVVISRLRDANTRVGKCMVKDMECAIAVLIQRLAVRQGQAAGEGKMLSLPLLRESAQFTCRMPAKNIDDSIQKLAKRELVKLSEGQKILVPDAEQLALFVEFRKLKSQGRQMVGADLTDQNHEFLSNINYVSQKSGQQGPEGVFCPISAIDFGEEKSNRINILELEKKGILKALPAGADGAEEGLVFDPKIVFKVKMIKAWLPRFAES